MNAPSNAVRMLGSRLVPWLCAPLGQMENAMAGERLGHAWLLTGPRGIGKINLALVLASRILEHQIQDAEPEPLGAAEATAAMRERHVPADRHPDLHWIFPEENKRAISVEQIRSVTERLGLKGYRGAEKVVVVEPAEAMTTGAANALLKTLEEPTPGTYLLLVTHQAGRLPATIRSRCQRLVLRPPEPSGAAAWLGELGGESVSAGPLRARPLRALELEDETLWLEINEIGENIRLVSRNELDPQALAERWLKLDLETLLEMLALHIQQAVRARFAGEDSTAVTDLAADTLHNEWSELTLSVLFEQLRKTEKLRDQIGRGTNVDLAVRVLLMGFKPG